MKNPPRYLSLKIIFLCATAIITQLISLSYFASPSYALSKSSNQCFTKVGTLSPEQEKEAGCKDIEGGAGGLGGPCQVAPPPPGDIVTVIRNKWNINLQNIPSNQLLWIWQEFHEIDCTGFLQDIRGTTVVGWGNSYSQQFSCPQQGGMNVGFGNYGESATKGLIVHELTHVWQFCSQRGEQSRLEIPAAYAAEGGLTTYSRSGCGFDISLHNEDHAETITFFLNPDLGEITCGNGLPNPYLGGKFPQHRGVAERGVGR